MPEAEGEASLWRALGREWPSYVGYAVSFLTIGIMWVNHHALFDRVAVVDRGLLDWNLFLLGAIGLVPFTTALMAQHAQGRWQPDSHLCVLGAPSPRPGWGSSGSGGT